jgi:hypothetical protein
MSGFLLQSSASKAGFFFISRYLVITPASIQWERAAAQIVTVRPSRGCGAIARIKIIILNPSGSKLTILGERQVWK